MEEHRDRVSAATSAATLGELQALVADLQTANAPVQLPDLTKVSPLRRAADGAGSGWGIRIAVAGVLVVLGVAIGWGLYGNTSSPLNFTSDPGAKSDGIPAKVLTAPRELQSLGGLNGLLEQMRQRFGDTMGYRMVVYPNYASVDRPDAGDDRRKLDYTYRGGFGDPSVSAVEKSDRVVDLAAFDVKAIVAALRGAPETLDIKRTEVTTTYLIVEPSSDPTAPAETLDVSIHLSSALKSGWIELFGDGSVKQISDPDS